MTTVRMPVRIRLDLTGGRLDAQLLDTVRDAVAAGTVRAVDRARGVAALGQAAWSGEPPAVHVRFRGEALPTWAAAHLETSARTAVQAAAAALRSGGAAAPAPVRTTTRLRRFASDEDLIDAVRDRVGAQPSTVVVAADGAGVGLLRFVERGPAGFLAVTRRITLSHWTVPPDDEDAVKAPGYGGWRADRLHFHADAKSPEVLRQRLAEMWVRQWQPANPHVPAAVLLDRARKQAAKFKNVTGTLYELREGGRPVRTYIGAPDLTRDSLPVLVLTEDVPVTSLDDRYGKNCPPLVYDPHAAANADPDRPFLHEPALSDWDTETYAGFSDLITVVVVQLGRPWPKFAGSFILDSLAFVRELCERLGALEATGPRKNVLRRLVTAVDALNVLMFAYTKAILARDRAKRLSCPLAGHAEEWATYLHHAYFPARRDTVASLFVAACQDALLAVLERSAADIAHRLASTDWLVATHAVLTSLLTDLPELTDMQAKLRSAKEFNLTTGGIDAGPTASYWHNGAQVLRTPVDPASPPGFGPVRTVYRIRDASGKWLRLEDVEAAVKSLRTEAALTDPFLEKLADIPQVVRRLQVARQLDGMSPAAGAAVTTGVDREFMAVLAEIKQLNEKHTAEARADRSVAFGLATFESDSRTEIHEKLSLVHREADELLKEMFRDKEIYDDGLTALAHQQISQRKFDEFLSFAGITLLAVFFPGIAFGIGVVQAAEGIATAEDHAELQRAMFDGDDILSRAQVEAERTSALIQGLLAVAPELGTMASGAFTGARALLKGELTEVTLLAFRRKMTELVARLAEATLEQLAVNFLVQAVSGYVLNLVLSEVIGELAQSVAEQYLPSDQVAGFVRRTVGTETAANGVAP